MLIWRKFLCFQLLEKDQNNAENVSKRTLLVSVKTLSAPSTIRWKSIAFLSRGPAYFLTIKSSRFSVGFRGINRLDAAFIFLRWIKRARIYIQVTSLHRWKKQGINHKFLVGNWFHVTLRIVSPYILFKYNLKYNLLSVAFLLKRSFWNVVHLLSRQTRHADICALARMFCNQGCQWTYLKKPISTLQNPRFEEKVLVRKTHTIRWIFIVLYYREISQSLTVLVDIYRC